jgi:hypothetical protein
MTLHRVVNRKQALVWLPAFVVSVSGLAYQLHGGVDYISFEALGGLLAIDGLLILVIAFSPRSSDSLFSEVRDNNDRDFGMITLLVFLSALLLINGLLDLKPAEYSSELVAGIGLLPTKGVTTLLGIMSLLIAMIALFLLLVTEFISSYPWWRNFSHAQRDGGGRASGAAS